jgi:hypothetical protein
MLKIKIVQHIKHTNIQKAAKKQTQAQTLRTKNEIKFIYKKKEQFMRNYTAYTYKLKTHGNTCTHGKNRTFDKSKITKQNEKIHEKQQKKVCNYPSYKRKTQHKKKHYPRIINTTNYISYNKRYNFLSKRLKYNLHYKQKNWLETALEVETAISKLHTTERQNCTHILAKQ